MKFFAGLGLIVLALSYLGRWLVFGDSLAVGRLHLLIGGLLLVVVFALKGAKWWARIVGLAVVLATLHTGWIWYGIQGPEGSFSLYQKNLLFINADHPAVISDIESSGAVVVTLQEVHERNLPILVALKGTYPYQLMCPFSGVGGVAILSKIPYVGGSPTCGDKDGFATAQIVVAQKGPVWIASVHMHWPWPYGQRDQLTKVLERLEKLSGPVLVGGDFNMQPWGSSVMQVAAAARAGRLGGYWSTFPELTGAIPLMIDQIMVPKGATGRVERRPLAGSDHYGLLAKINL